MTDAASPLVQPTALERPMYWFVGLGSAVAELIQVHVRTNTGELNANFGDPVAIIGGIIFVGVMRQAGTVARFWCVSKVFGALALIAGLLAVGLLRGYIAYGPIDWAIFNRFLVWFVLLAYFCSGTLIVAVAGRAGLGSLCRVLVAASAGLVVWELLQRFAFGFLGVEFGQTPAVRDEGLSGNPNAFAFQLLQRASDGASDLRGC